VQIYDATVYGKTLNPNAAMQQLPTTCASLGRSSTDKRDCMRTAAATSILLLVGMLRATVRAWWRRQCLRVRSSEPIAILRSERIAVASGGKLCLLVHEVARLRFC